MNKRKPVKSRKRTKRRRVTRRGKSSVSNQHVVMIVLISVVFATLVTLSILYFYQRSSHLPSSEKLADEKQNIQSQQAKPKPKKVAHKKKSPPPPPPIKFEFYESLPRMEISFDRKQA